ELLEGLKESDLINERELKLILYAIDDKSLCMPIYELKEKVRSNILKNIIIGLL
ncbi:CtsR family transcriptional regulator, partial [Clostridioides difficile]|nr:CtsR family transcriptional regulator [Clostridioides difficile]